MNANGGENEAVNARVIGETRRAWNAVQKKGCFSMPSKFAAGISGPENLGDNGVRVWNGDGKANETTRSRAIEKKKGSWFWCM
jgi:hypothetical protein